MEFDSKNSKISLNSVKSAGVEMRDEMLDDKVAMKP